MPRATKLENEYKAGLHNRIRDLFPGCYILINDSGYMQGVPDTLVLWREKWAMLEVKRKKPTRASDFEPNQEWYIEEFDRMSFGACIYPENEEEVLYALQEAFRRPRRSSRRP